MDEKQGGKQSRGLTAATRLVSFGLSYIAQSVNDAMQVKHSLAVR